MISYLRLTFSIFCYISIVALILFVIGFILTSKYKNKYRGFYAVFLGITKREIFIHVTSFLNCLLLFYFLFNINAFYRYGLIMIILINLLSCTFSFNFHIIIMDVVYTCISSLLFMILRLVNNYLVDVVFDYKVNILRVVFMILVAMYIVYITVRKLEVTMKSYKGLRRT